MTVWDALSAHRIFIGTITPSSNTVVERVTLAILREFPEVSAHFSRIPVVGDKDPFPDRYDLDNMLSAARLLAHARLDVICWNGSKGLTIGVEQDRKLCERIRAETGVAATTSIIALEESLRARGIERIALVSPYASHYQEKTVAALERQGYRCIAEAHSGLADNYAYSQVPPQNIAEMLRRVARAEPEAILTVCTNFPAAPIAPALEDEIGIPIFDTTSLGVWHALKLAGVATAPGRAWGRLFES